MGGEVLGEKYMAAKKKLWVESFRVKNIWLQKKIVGGEVLGEKYMAAKKKLWVESFWVKSIWLQEKIVGKKGVDGMLALVPPLSGSFDALGRTHRGALWT